MKTTVKSIFVAITSVPRRCTIALVCLMAAGSLQAQVLVNSDPDFEAATLTAWNPQISTNTTITLESSAQSPFTSGNQGVEFTVSASPGSSPKIFQTLGSSYGTTTAFLLSFDFNSVGSYAGGDGVIIARMFDDAGGNNSVFFTGTKSIAVGGTTVDTTAYNSNTWYHVEVSLPSLADANTGTASAMLNLTPFGGSTTSYSATWSIASGGTYYKTLQFQTGFGSQPNTDVYLDNAYLTTIPEPSTYVLLGVGLAAILILKGFNEEGPGKSGWCGTKWSVQSNVTKL